MEKFLAWMFVLVASLAAGLGNFWFTYGLWPRSWAAFVIFAVVGGVLSQMLSALIKNEQK